MRYWVFHQRQVVGPLGSTDLRALPGFSSQTLVCPERLEGGGPFDWRQAAVVGELRELFRDAAAEPGARSPAAQPTASPQLELKIAALEEVIGRLQESLRRQHGAIEKIHEELSHDTASIERLTMKVGELEKREISAERRLEQDELEQHGLHADVALLKTRLERGREALADVLRVMTDGGIPAPLPVSPAPPPPPSQAIVDAALSAAPPSPPPPPPSSTVDKRAVPPVTMTVAARLEGLPLGGFHWNLAALIGLCYMLGVAFNMELFPIALLGIKKDWALSLGQISLLGTLSAIGALAGSLVSGSLSSRWGRKSLLIVALAIAMLANAATGLAGSFAALVACRFLVWGCAWGLLTPASALIVELSPTAQRGRLFSLAQTLWPMGDVLGVAVGCFLVPLWGWRLPFLASGLFLLIVAFLWKRLPESPRYLESIGRWGEAQDIVRGIESRSGLEPVALVPARPAASSTAAKADWRSLWTGGRARRTFVLWVLFFTSAYAIGVIVQWLPLLLVMYGQNAGDTFRYVLAHTILSLPALFISASLMDRLGRKLTLTGYLLGCAAASLGFGYFAHTGLSILAWGGCARFSLAGIKCGIQGYAQENYPTELRTLGAGTANGVSRLGLIVAPLTVGALASRWPGRPDVVFTHLAVLLAVTAVVLMVAGEETMGRALG